jgi:hypothetical protein
VQTEQRNSLRLLQWMMAASVALPVALFAFVSAISWASTRDTADRHPLYVSAGLETSAIRSRWLAAISQHLIFGLPATALLFLILALALRRTGIDLADEIRRRHFDLPVVLTSGYSHLLSQNDNYKFELLQKPYSIEQFARGLDEVGRWRRQNRGAAE